ncbi:MAG: class I SAM-dependent methyltransferase [Anaerolineae bacterium]|nr:class I SAM-dependent methyltransferase [Anaerolineae bacterium]
MEKIKKVKRILMEEAFYDHAWGEWDDMKQYGPVSRHVRRLIFKMLGGIEFASVLDVGCGVGTLLQEIKSKYPHVELAGTEYASTGLEITQSRIPDGQFSQLDLSKSHLDETYDLLFCIDVLEHIDDDVSAMRNLRAMTNKYLLAVVPIGPLFEIERERVGHVHGYKWQEFDQKLEDADFDIVRHIQWGFPFYNIYRRILHRLPESTVSGKYGLYKRFISFTLYVLHFLNLPVFGERHFVLCKITEEI